MRTVALPLALCLLFAGVARPVLAAPSPAATAPAEPAPDPALADAQRLYTEGLTHYETLDYDLAIERWKEALGRLREVDAASVGRAAEARNAIVYNIASAQEKAFDQDRDVARLKKAKGLLERYVEEHVAAGVADDEDLAKARTRIAELAARIDEFEKAAKPAPEPAPKPVPTPVDAAHPGRGLIIGGVVMAVVGVGVLAGGVAAGSVISDRAEDRLRGLGELADEPARLEALERGRLGDNVLIACAVTGGLLAAAGVGLAGAGASKRSKASGRALAPAVGRTFAGVVLRGRF